jgi:hypothetical protein
MAGKVLLTTVFCGHCGYSNMGCCFKKAIAKRKSKRFTMKEKREIISKYCLLPEMPIGSLILEGLPLPHNAPTDHPARILWDIKIKIRDIVLPDEKLVCKALKMIDEKGSPIDRKQLLEVISPLGNPSALIRRASYYGLIDRKVKRSASVEDKQRKKYVSYYSLTDQGQKILAVAEYCWDYITKR